MAGGPPVPAYLLVDITGNTHRAEICIDKLYSPDGPTGRLGLVEFRALEMPPDPRMSLAQQLLIRALIAIVLARAAAGHSSCAGALRCTIASCCRISSGRIFSACSSELEAVRLRFRAGMVFARSSSFAFPSIGARPSWRRDAGAAAGAGALACARRGGRRPAVTVRYVDSSVERLQVKVDGFRARAAMSSTCNGRRMPMTSTGRSGEAVAGVRFKAWQPACRLHPTISGPRRPDVRHLIDTWNGRSLGGCVYWPHVAPIRRAQATTPSR